MEALAGYDSDENGSDGEIKTNIEEATLHLKPLEPDNLRSSVKNAIAVAAAPEIVTKVGIGFSFRSSLHSTLLTSVVTVTHWHLTSTKYLLTQSWIADRS